MLSGTIKIVLPAPSVNSHAILRRNKGRRKNWRCFVQGNALAKFGVKFFLMKQNIFSVQWNKFVIVTLRPNASFLKFLDHTQRRTTKGRTALGK